MVLGEFPSNAHNSEVPSPEPIGNSFEQKDILSLKQFTLDSIDALFEVASEMREIGRNALPSNLLAGNIATLLFYEPSSRTRASFDAAAKQLGGQTVVVENPQQFSSVSKGETFEDTIRTFESYCDTIILRHPDVGSARIAAETAKYVPIINAGDGTGEHPTQALLDMYTIKEHSGSLSNLVGVCGGDIKNGRTVHSLLDGLSLYKSNTLFLLSPKELQIGPEEKAEYEQKGLEIIEINSMDEIPPDANFWYWTRVQKERFATQEEYAKVNNQFVVSEENFQRLAGERTGLMHPLPRVGEISPKLDNDPRSLYLQSQIRNGMYIRMGLLALVLGKIK